MPGTINTVQSAMPPFEEYVELIRPLWETHWLTNMGTIHEQFRAGLLGYTKADNVALFCNGHHALEVCFEAMGLGTDGRKKVITTPFTFVSTTNAIVRSGLEPVFVDVKPDDYTLDPAKVEEAMDEDVCAIVPVHVYGNLCDDDALEAIAKKWDVPVLYDAAHTFGVTKDGVSSACFGAAAMYSFHATKTFHSVEGGAVFYRDEALATNLRQMKNFGISSKTEVDSISGNAKMSEFHAAMGLLNLKYIEDEIAKRERVAQRYYERLDGVPGLKVTKPNPGIRSNHCYLPVLFQGGFGATRDEVWQSLWAQDVHCSRYFYPTVPEYKCYREKYDASRYPVAIDISRRVLTLPMYGALPLEDVDRVCDAVLGARR